jgi:hypothetical protein
VVGDVGDLLGEQARVDGVADRGHARDGVVELEMPVGVPGQGADPVFGLDAKRQQRTRQLRRERAMRIGIGVAVRAADRQAGYDFRIAVVLAGVLQQAGNHQRPVHHQAKHLRSPLCVLVESQFGDGNHSTGNSLRTIGA